MYDITQRKQFGTVADLKELLKEMPDEAKIYIIGDDECWFHATKDKNIICLDCEDLELEYEE